MKNSKFLLILCVVFSGHLISQCPDGYITGRQNLVQNGDFSLGNASFESDYKYILETECGNHWLPEGMYSILPSPKLAHCHFSNCTDHTNSKSAMLIVNGATIPNQVVWQQKIKVTPNTIYYFSTWICNALNDSPSKMEFSINGKALGEPIIAPNVACEWKQFATTWSSEVNSEAVISILNQSTISQGNDFMLDDIVFYTCERPNFKDQLIKAETGSVIELRNVFFDTGSDQLKKESNDQLNELLGYLNKFPSAEIEVRGHTDNVGNDDDNMKLSQKRARSVCNYLLKNGIKENRLKSNGFGETQSVDSNVTIEGRQKNRRVEFVLIKK